MRTVKLSLLAAGLAVTFVVTYLSVDSPLNVLRADTVATASRLNAVRYGYLGKDGEFRLYADAQIASILADHVELRAERAACVDDALKCLEKQVLKWYFAATDRYLTAARTVEKDLDWSAIRSATDNPATELPATMRQAGFMPLNMILNGSELSPELLGWSRRRSFVGVQFVTKDTSLRPFFVDMNIFPQSGDATPFASDEDLLTVEKYAAGNRLYRAELTSKVRGQLESIVVSHPYAPTRLSEEPETYVLTGTGIFQKEVVEVLEFDVAFIEQMKTPPPRRLEVTSEAQGLYGEFRRMILKLDSSLVSPAK